MAKKKDKSKDIPKAKEKPIDEDRPRRKELAREIERLRAHNEVLRARLERIAEIASSELPDGPISTSAVVPIAPQE